MSGSEVGVVNVYRLDRLREVVPHPDRANTAAFLETVIEYVTHLKNKIAQLEAQLQAAGQQAAPEMVNAAPAVQAPTAEVRSPNLVYRFEDAFVAQWLQAAMPLVSPVHRQ